MFSFTSWYYWSDHLNCTLRGLLMDNKNQMFSLPQASPDGLSDEMEGLTFTSKYKRMWVNYFLSTWCDCWIKADNDVVVCLQVLWQEGCTSQHVQAAESRLRGGEEDTQRWRYVQYVIVFTPASWRIFKITYIFKGTPKENLNGTIKD